MTKEVACGKCGTTLVYDKDATYLHWRYYCPTCEEFKIVSGE